MKALMLLGMHRSYTSLVARWLSECNLKMGDGLLAGGVGNEDGHFEDLEFFELHRAALRARGLPENGMVTLNDTAFDTEAFRSLRFEGDVLTQAEELLAARLQSGERFGWKEPRTCLFLPFYRERLDCCSLALVRPYQEVVASLIEREPLAAKNFTYVGVKRPLYWLRRGDFERKALGLKNDFLKAWIHYNECLLDHIQSSPSERVMVHNLQSIGRNSEAVIAQLCAWGFPAHHRSFEDYLKPLSNREPIEFDAALTRRADELTEAFAQLIEGG